MRQQQQWVKKRKKNIGICVNSLIFVGRCKTVIIFRRIFVRNDFVAQQELAANGQAHENVSAQKSNARRKRMQWEICSFKMIPKWPDATHTLSSNPLLTRSNNKTAQFLLNKSRGALARV